MDQAIFEDKIQYDAWVELLLAVPLVLLLVLGVLFYIDGYHSNIFPKDPPRESRIAFIVVCFSTSLTAAAYWLFLPQKISVFQDGIRVKFGGFSWNIPFRSVAACRAVKGLIFPPAFSAITSYKSQIVIIRKGRLKIRISPSRRDEFLESANRALADWIKMHPDATRRA